MTATMGDHGRVEALVERARAGDRGAFDELVRSYEARLRAAVARWLGAGRETAEADEVVQETFVLALEAIGRFEWKRLCDRILRDVEV
jgi:DNA-directed RNA polymerase specialized sigma24 family protein